MKQSRRLVSVTGISLLLCVGVWAQLDGTSALADQQSPAKAAGAEAYYQWLQTCLDGLEKDIPSITKSAEAAARLYVRRDAKYMVYPLGDEGFKAEVVGRSGGLCLVGRGWNIRPNREMIVLLVLREDKWDQTIAVAKKAKSPEHMVIAFGRAELIERARQEGVEFDFVIDNHAAPHGGLFQDTDGNWVVPTSPTANIAAQRGWMGEFIAACTRLGRMPAVLQAYAVPGGRKRDDKLGFRKFHGHEPRPMPPGRAGAEYLKVLRRDLASLRRHGMGNIRKLADLALAIRAEGKTVYGYFQSHGMMKGQVGYPGDLGYFEQYNETWFKPRNDVTLQAGDLVFCVGYDQQYHGWGYRDWDRNVRKQGVRLAHSFTSYPDVPRQTVPANKRSDASTIPPDEIYIDQRWGWGDAVVEFPGYDVKVLTVSGVICDAIWWMVNAEMFEILSKSAPVQVEARPYAPASCPAASAAGCQAACPAGCKAAPPATSPATRPAGCPDA